MSISVNIDKSIKLIDSLEGVWPIGDEFFLGLDNNGEVYACEPCSDDLLITKDQWCKFIELHRPQYWNDV